MDSSAEPEADINHEPNDEPEYLPSAAELQSAAMDLAAVSAAELQSTAANDQSTVAVSFTVDQADVSSWVANQVSTGPQPQSAAVDLAAMYAAGLYSAAANLQSTVAASPPANQAEISSWIAGQASTVPQLRDTADQLQSILPENESTATHELQPADIGMQLLASQIQPSTRRRPPASASVRKRAWDADIRSPPVTPMPTPMPASRRNSARRKHASSGDAQLAATDTIPPVAAGGETPESTSRRSSSNAASIASGSNSNAASIASQSTPQSRASNACSRTPSTSDIALTHVAILKSRSGCRVFYQTPQSISIVSDAPFTILHTAEPTMPDVSVDTSTEMSTKSSSRLEDEATDLYTQEELEERAGMFSE